MSVASNNRFLMKTNPQLTRALADGGSSLNHPEIQRLARQQVDLGLWGNLKLWVHRDLVKTRTSGSNLFVPKVYDLSSNNNDAVQATTANQPKLVSTGMEFDGSDDSLNAGNATSLRVVNDFSVSLWLYMNDATASSNYYIANRWNTSSKRVWALLQGSGGSKIRLFKDRTGSDSGVNNATTNNNMTTGSWLHVVGIFLSTGDGFLIYINGDSVAITLQGGSRTSDCFTTDTNLLIGGLAASHYANALSNDLRLFDKVLSATEISAIYNETKSYYGL